LTPAAAFSISILDDICADNANHWLRDQCR
jgi:hypothetical protein